MIGSSRQHYENADIHPVTSRIIPAGQESGIYSVKPQNCAGFGLRDQPQTVRNEPNSRQIPVKAVIPYPEKAPQRKPANQARTLSEKRSLWYRVTRETPQNCAVLRTSFSHFRKGRD